MASGFHLVFFFCSISGLLIVESRSVQGAGEVPVPPGCSPGCPPGWTQFGSRCFIFYHTAKNWIDAEHFCMSIGGNLASVHSADESLFLSELVKRVTGVHHHTWVGGFDAVAENGSHEEATRTVVTTKWLQRLRQVPKSQLNGKNKF
ncbi:lactose-binding lectin l-2-like [Odontesthes bonariensis]|uniref:lactose-binding lectin l-2-like n=1 Tax=Odontesthes bonariensis TaxID=219752 RepID=UPI003F58257A